MACEIMRNLDGSAYPDMAISDDRAGMAPTLGVPEPCHLRDAGAGGSLSQTPPQKNSPVMNVFGGHFPIEEVADSVTRQCARGDVVF